MTSNNLKNSIERSKSDVNNNHQTASTQDNKKQQQKTPHKKKKLYPLSTHTPSNDIIVIDSNDEKTLKLYTDQLRLEDAKAIERLKNKFYKFGLLFKGESNRVDIAISLLEEINILPKGNSIFNLTKSISNFSIIHAGLCHPKIRPIFEADEIMSLLDFCKNRLVFNCRERHNEIKRKRDKNQLGETNIHHNHSSKKKNKETNITPPPKKEDLNKKKNYQDNSSKNSRSSENNFQSDDVERFNINYSDKIKIDENSSFSETDSGSENGSGVNYNDYDFEAESDDDSNDLNFQDLSEISSMESDEQTKYYSKQQNQKNTKTTFKKKRKSKQTPTKKTNKKEKKYSKKRKSKNNRS
ncbi:hypothetical protein M0813_02679 [Anaeramoeba flamelloides]|uniref:DUF4476 domain-containing protein n=1 Tax=Anaeramoeba flamelloides TaxID=1746091 RepID=A0ABQ8YE34_9EUKA|nr:hypothetical protein M0813_02679 [Anaeramoeba flamelloides]